jgi:hypothetical protein
LRSLLRRGLSAEACPPRPACAEAAERRLW